MAIPSRVKSIMDKNGLKSVNTPKKTPNNPKKSHVVMASENGVYKLIHFGQQGVKTNQTVGQREAFESRHAKNIAKGKMSPGYWSAKEKWAPGKTKSTSKKWVKGS